MAETTAFKLYRFDPDVDKEPRYQTYQVPTPPGLTVLLGLYHILENMDTAELVKDQAWEFLFTLGPARITGAVQAIVNPVAVK